MQSNDLEFKVNKQELCRRVVAKLSEMDVCDIDDSDIVECTYNVPRMVEALLSEIEDIVCQGGKVSLMGFGTFLAQKHKGHPVQFGDGKIVVDDYFVFKFIVSHVLNERLRSMSDKTIEKAGL